MKRTKMKVKESSYECCVYIELRTISYALMSALSKLAIVRCQSFIWLLQS